MLDASLLGGVIPAIVSIVGTLAMAFLLIRRSRPWMRRVPTGIAVAIVVVGVADLTLLAWKPFPDPLPARVLFWAGFAILAIALAGLRIPSNGWPGRAALAPAILGAVLLAAIKINAFYGYWPTVGAALNISTAKETDFAAIAAPRPTVAGAPDEALARSWHAPSDMPRTGEITRVAIAGAKSGFRARPASMYLPPAYLASPRPLLPVLVLIPGQPGGPQDWLVAGTLSKVMDSFAATHAGLAPIVIVPDATGTPLANPMRVIQDARTVSYRCRSGQCFSRSYCLLNNPPCA